MRILIVKLVVTPWLMGGISLLGRRWGPTVGRLLVRLPPTSGSVAMFLAMFLALERDTRFAASTLLGILAGVSPVACSARATVDLRFACAGAAHCC